MLVGHRWERDWAWRGFRCIPLPLGGVESHQWCVGCDCIIGDKELYESKLPIDEQVFLHIALDMLASHKGYKPVEAGTMAEFRLKPKRLKEA